MATRRRAESGRAGLRQVALLAAEGGGAVREGGGAGKEASKQMGGWGRGGGATEEGETRGGEALPWREEEEGERC